MYITLALGAGGARGNAHIGVIRRLEKEGFQIKALAGTSFGGIVAVFYALGCTPDEIEEIFTALDQTQLYGHAPDDGPSLLGLAGVKRWLRETLGEKTFADLKLPCIVTAADLKSGQEVLISQGSLVDAILATITLPGIFPARYVEDMELVDGGTIDPVPVAAARALAPGLPVVAVVLTTRIGVPTQSWNIPLLPSFLPRGLVERIGKMRYALAMDVSMRALDIVTRAVTQYRLEVDKPEIIIRPRVGEIDTLDIVDVHEVALRGEAAVEEVLPRIRKYFTLQNRLRRLVGMRTWPVT
jgi:NTE family protein